MASHPPPLTSHVSATGGRSSEAPRPGPSLTVTPPPAQEGALREHTTEGSCPWWQRGSDPQRKQGIKTKNCGQTLQKHRTAGWTPTPQPTPRRWSRGSSCAPQQCEQGMLSHTCTHTLYGTGQRHRASLRGPRGDTAAHRQEQRAPRLTPHPPGVFSAPELREGSDWGLHEVTQRKQMLGGAREGPAVLLVHFTH